MNLESPQQATFNPVLFQRGEDRRSCTRFSPPPYETVNGLIMADRRSYLDRRASWLREFSLEIGLPG